MIEIVQMLGAQIVSLIMAAVISLLIWLISIVLMAIARATVTDDELGDDEEVALRVISLVIAAVSFLIIQSKILIEIAP